ncbi:hypothetical protein EVAR_55360_1 [Eumeta japonica]|uniref:Uncharacterized protein n=1 Tax=Eumeta variegata TaxID=151549 RepID=A0A4C1YWJ6_EUMVA|nr:hypothetical protein EVAR_55360_1 [Eumeta japonica]
MPPPKLQSDQITGPQARFGRPRPAALPGGLYCRYPVINRRGRSTERLSNGSGGVFGVCRIVRRGGGGREPRTARYSLMTNRTAVAQWLSALPSTQGYWIVILTAVVPTTPASDSRTSLPMHSGCRYDCCQAFHYGGTSFPDYSMKAFDLSVYERIEGSIKRGNPISTPKALLYWRRTANVSLEHLSLEHLSLLQYESLSFVQHGQRSVIGAAINQSAGISAPVVAVMRGPAAGNERRARLAGAFNAHNLL